MFAKLRSQLRWSMWIILNLPRSVCFGGFMPMLFSPRYNESMTLKAAVVGDELLVSFSVFCFLISSQILSICWSFFIRPRLQHSLYLNWNANVSPLKIVTPLDSRSRILDQLEQRHRSHLMRNESLLSAYFILRYHGWYWVLLKQMRDLSAEKAQMRCVRREYLCIGRLV